ncbi:MAG TPA: hypothetical protein VL523_09140 [Terriglobia bacterium]|nr:hypothetical protein [Terriglobia bacterium]
MPRIFRRESHGPARHHAPKPCVGGYFRWCVFSGPGQPRKIENITNEPTNLLKALIFHFWNMLEPTKLLKTGMIGQITNHLIETNGDKSQLERPKDPKSDQAAEDSDEMAAKPTKLLKTDAIGSRRCAQEGSAARRRRVPPTL